MATITIQPDPFVKWKFKCKNAQEQKEKKEMAKTFLKFYLEGFAKALRLGNPNLPKFSYALANEQFLPVPNSSKEFTYSATLKRRSEPGVPFPAPDSTITPVKPSKPTP